MAKYIVQPGDTLWKISQKLGISGGWQELFNQNKKIISNPNLIYSGMSLQYGGAPDSTDSGGGTSGGGNTTAEDPNANLTQSQRIAKGLTTESLAKQNFATTYGTEEELRPDYMFRQFAESLVNPEQMRMAVQQVANTDWALAQSGRTRSGMAMSERERLINQLEQQRLAAVEGAMAPQQDLFNTWYNNQMQGYMDSPVSSAYTLGVFNNGNGSTITPAKNQPRFQYNSPINYNNFFKWGGYSQPTSLTGGITEVPAVA